MLSHDLRFTAEPLVTGWNRALERHLDLEITTFPIGVAGAPDDPSPDPSSCDPRAEFSVSRADRNSIAGSDWGGYLAAQVPQPGGGLSRNTTRICPPADVIKLEDRLNYCCSRLWRPC